ncbi:MAG: hypothetical protein ACOYM2_16940 [Rectinemataceae bacterium]
MRILLLGATGGSSRAFIDAAFKTVLKEKGRNYLRKVASLTSLMDQG